MWLQKYDIAVLLLNQPLFHTLMPSFGPCDGNQEVWWPLWPCKRSAMA